MEGLGRSPVSYDFQLPLAGTPPDAAFNYSAPCHGNVSSGSSISAGFQPITMIPKEFSKDARRFPRSVKT
jgi:hypothetical protein